MAVLEVNCNNQKLNWKEEPTQLFSGNIKIDGITFSFCPLWDGFIKTAVFYKDGEEDNAFYFVLDENNTCFIPHEITGTQGLIYVGVFGVKDECRRTTEPIAFYLDKGIVTEGNPSEPTPDIYAQIVTLCNKAVETANSVEERANNGEFNGKDGTNGKDGKDGVDGKNGIDGKDGYNPQKGIDYFDGKDGKDGENGKDGKDGQDGHTPVKGEDYFTEEDIDGLNDDLNFVKDTGAELIEEITVTEEGIREIIRTAEPDGTPYNFKAVSVLVQKTPWKVANVVVTRAYTSVNDMGTNSRTSYRASLTASETAGKFTHAYFDVFAGHWFALGCYGTPQTVPMAAQIWRGAQLYKNHERIKKIMVEGYTTAFEVGTVIQIYGVRA